jgi:hypothetical protein
MRAVTLCLVSPSPKASDLPQRRAFDADSFAAVHLWQVTGRGSDQSRTSIVAEAAATTIALILNQTQQSGVDKLVGSGIGVDGLAGGHIGSAAGAIGAAEGPSAGLLTGSVFPDDYYHTRRRSFSALCDTTYERGRQLSRGPLLGPAPPYYTGFLVDPSTVPAASSYRTPNSTPGISAGASAYPVAATNAYSPGGYQSGPYSKQYIPSATASYAAGFGAPTYINEQQQPAVLIKSSGHRHGRQHGHHRHHRNHLEHRSHSLDRYGNGYAY